MVMKPEKLAENQGRKINTWICQNCGQTTMKKPNPYKKCRGCGEIISYVDYS